MSQQNGIEIIEAGKKVGVLLPLVFRAPFDYRLPDGREAVPGDYVRVPFGNKHVYGVVWGEAEGSVENSKIKAIETVCIHVPPMRAAMRNFIDWVAWYTLSPAGQVLKMAIPVPEALEPPVAEVRYVLNEDVASCRLQVAGKLKLTPARTRIISYLADGIPRNIKEITAYAKVSPNVVRDFIKAGGLATCNLQLATPDLQLATRNYVFAPRILSEQQKAAATELRDKIDKGFSVSLLDGVTGSGKTEVYFDVIEECVKSGKQTLVMLPEIALSIQWFARFEKHFGFAPHIWHSSIAPAKRRDHWRDVAQGTARVVVGARSALFLPFKNLALIVADEEHDASYKQEEGVIYHARDMAVARARHENIPILLVSATPSLETEFNIEHRRYSRIHLPVRHNAAQMPAMTLIDMRKHAAGRDQWISEPLKNALIKALARGNQAMIFMNRRGYAPLVLCRACGHRFQCPHCTSWLVLHRAKNMMLCHHCGYSATLPRTCPQCKSEGTLIPYGPGVERIAEELRALFPNARTQVMTSDSMIGGTLPPSELRSDSPARSSHRAPPRTHASDIINDMIAHKIDILVGTQMIAKGHHFAGLALVGVIDADMGLGGGDLRASERTYQLLHQLSGRAGREKTAGEVYLQTYMPEHPVMQALAAGDRDRFMQLEASMREDAGMPPYGKLASIVIEGKNEQETAKFARDVASCRLQVAGKETNNLPLVTRNPPLILGPAPAPLARLKNKYRYRILIKAGRNFPMQQFLAGWLPAKVPAAFKLKVDVEPYSFV